MQIRDKCNHSYTLQYVYIKYEQILYAIWSSSRQQPSFTSLFLFSFGIRYLRRNIYRQAYQVAMVNGVSQHQVYYSELNAAFCLVTRVRKQSDAVLLRHDGLYMYTIIINKINKSASRCIPHKAGQAEGTQCLYTPFPTFCRILEALRVEWQNSTPRFASRQLVLTPERRN